MPWLQGEWQRERERERESGGFEGVGFQVTGRECLRQDWNKVVLVMGTLAVGVLQLWLAIGVGEGS